MSDDALYNSETLTTPQLAVHYAFHNHILNNPSIRITPLSPIILQLRNSSYENFKKNGFRHTFVNLYTEADFKANNQSKALIIMNDQIRLNYGQSLVYDTDFKIKTLGYLKDLSNNVYPLENLDNGLDLRNYVINNMEVFGKICSDGPANLDDLSVGQPYHYQSGSFTLDINKQMTGFNSDVCVVKLTGKRVLLFGTELKSIIF
jgi:hypothetical protein